MAFSTKELLFCLYFVQGLPYGLQTYYLPIYFHSVLNFSTTAITLTNLLSFPWMIKFMWGPFVDRYKTKRFWLIFINFLLMSICLFGSLATLQGLFINLFILFLINLLASIQDVIVDATAISMLQYQSMALAGITQVVAYKLGAVFSGGFGSLFMDWIGWKGFLMLMSGFFCAAALASYVSRELKIHEAGEIEYNQLEQSSESESGVNNRNTIKAVFCSFADPKTLWTIILLIVYKIGEQGTLRITPIYMLIMGVPKEQVSTWFNLVGGSLSIIGSVLGGLIVGWHNFNAKQLLWIVFHLRLLPAAFIMLIAIANRNTPPQEYSESFLVNMVLCDLMLTFMGGMITTITCTVMMQLTKLQPKHLQATYMSLFSTIEVLGKLVFVSMSGYLTELLDFSGVFLLFVLIDILSIPILEKM